MDFTCNGYEFFFEIEKDSTAAWQIQLVENGMGIHLTALLGQFDAACAAADELAEAAIAHFDRHPDAEIITAPGCSPRSVTTVPASLTLPG